DFLPEPCFPGFKLPPAVGSSAAHLSLRQLAKTLAMGQGLAGLICGTAITSQFLASNFHVNTPMLQSFLNYLLLTVTYTTMLLCRTGDGNFLQILKRRWWKYLLLGLVDVEANYTVVKAYQYTTITSIQLLDCFVIPVLMGLSWWILKARYRLIHSVAVCICLLGVGAMVGADLLAGRDQGSTSNILLGDGLVLLSASLYAVSNVCQEYTVKNLSRVEFLGMVGLFGTIISTIQMTAVRCLCTVYVCSVQLHAYSDKAKQRHLRQPLPAHR
uniref:Info solute carrier family 35 member F2, like n=1 Tax=Pundamilia nyererei TaxID=303518 RepID=A0A3B4H0X6_9CICH